MGNISRFLNASYVFNTIVIKSRATLLKIKRGVDPYTYFNDKTSPKSLTEYSLCYSDTYHSLVYLNNKKALKLHSGERSLTQDLIVGLVYYNELIKNNLLEGKLLIDLALALKEKATLSENRMTFYFNEAYDRFDVNGSYSSGIVQGKAASFFLRCYRHTKEEKFKLWAKNCLLSAWIPLDEGGVLRKLSNNQFWIEEYPSPRPSMVLNGFLFYIIALAEYLTIEDDDVIKNQFELSLQSVLTWMPNYKLGHGLLYSMYRWSLCNVHYTGIMKFQFEHLYMLTGIVIFKEYAEFTDHLTDWKTFNSII